MSLEGLSPTRTGPVQKTEEASSPFFKSHDRSRGLFGNQVPAAVVDTRPAHAGESGVGFRYDRVQRPASGNVYRHPVSKNDLNEFDPDDFDFDGIPLDAFDKELLAQTAPDRRSQAENGQARLSLAPRPTRMERIERPDFGHGNSIFAYFDGL
jgi:hypothetical protein